jgi:outer membrane protein
LFRHVKTRESRRRLGAVFALAASAIFSIGPSVLAEEPTRRVLSLSEALSTAKSHQPTLRIAEADARAAEAQVTVSRADWLPQLTGTASYQRLTGNFVARPGSVPSSVNASARKRNSSLETFNFWSFGLNANQLVYDFGQTGKRLKADKQTAKATRKDQAAVARDVAAQVRLAFFNAQAQKALIEVTRAALDNQEKHLEQVQAFVDVGTRPEIDLAQQKADTANARVLLLQTQNAYLLALVTLNQAMGAEGDADFDVSEERLLPVEGEDQAAEVLWQKALSARAELMAAEERVRARELSLSAARAGHAPSIGLTGSVTKAGTDLKGSSAMGWNFGGGAVLTVPFSTGGRVTGQVREAEALLYREMAGRDALRQTIRVELEQARLTVVSQKAVLSASLEAVEAARTRLNLAEGRYQAGVGNIIELGDAQLALSQAEAQRVQAEYGLSAARAELLRALGQDG